MDHPKRNFSLQPRISFCPMHSMMVAYSCYKKITISANQGNDEIANNCSSGNVSLIGIVFIGTPLTSLHEWSTTTFSTPFLSLIVISNSWSKRIYLSSLGFASFFVNRYLRAACSVNIKIRDPTR